MKKLLIATLFVVSSMSYKVYAQQQGQFSQYMLNYYLVNPAVSGTEDYTDIKAGYRNQWTGFSGAPKNYYVSGHTPLGKISKKQQRGKRRAVAHQSVGGLVTGQSIGALNHTGAYLSYAYHLPLTEKLMLSMGLSAGAQMYSIDQSKLDFGDNIADPVLTSTNKTNFDMNAGFWLYSQRVFLGVSSMQILGNKLEFGQADGAGALNRHFYVTGGFKINITDDLKLIPSTMVKLQLPSAYQFDLNAKVRYKDFLWAGVGYRNQDAIVALAGVLIKNMIEIGYSYDMTTSNINKYSGGSHEIMVGVRFDIKGRMICPSDFW